MLLRFAIRKMLDLNPWPEREVRQLEPVGAGLAQRLQGQWQVWRTRLQQWYKAWRKRNTTRTAARSTPAKRKQK